MGFPRQEYWSGLPFPPLGNLADAGIDPALADGFFTTSATWEVSTIVYSNPPSSNTYTFLLTDAFGFLGLPFLVVTVSSLSRVQFFATP